MNSILFIELSESVQYGSTRSKLIISYKYFRQPFSLIFNNLNWSRSKVSLMQVTMIRNFYLPKTGNSAIFPVLNFWTSFADTSCLLFWPVEQERLANHGNEQKFDLQDLAKFENFWKSAQWREFRFLVLKINKNKYWTSFELDF